MKIKKLLFAALMLVAAVSYGQNTPNVITTAVPFVSINRSDNLKLGRGCNAGKSLPPEAHGHYVEKVICRRKL